MQYPVLLRKNTAQKHSMFQKRLGSMVSFIESFESIRIATNDQTPLLHQVLDREKIEFVIVLDYPYFPLNLILILTRAADESLGNDI